MRSSLEHELAHSSRICLAAHRLHDRADDRTGSLHLAIANLLEHVGLLRERRIDRLDQRAIIRDDRLPSPSMTP